MYKIPNVISKSIFLLIALIAFSAFPVKSAYSQFQCLPTCDVTDGRLFIMAGVGASTINNQDTILGIVTPGSEAMIEIGIFDGDASTTWDDIGPPTQFEATLMADPLGDGTGLTVLATYSSDGSFGDNIGDPMVDNDWYNITLPNSSAAMNADGNFSYVFMIRNLTPNIEAFNLFKVRTLDPSAFFIFEQTAFNVLTPAGFFSNPILYPNFTGPGDPACFDPMTTEFCDPADPMCCLSDSTYDGTYTFFFEVPEGTTELEMWDGDFDYQSSFLAGPFDCQPDGIDADTDDPNTPGDPFLPTWAIGTTAVFEGVGLPASPFDDICNNLQQRSPSATYRIIDPFGVVYENSNPSGDEEWEKFSLTTIAPLDPAVDDLLVSDLPAGVWRLEIIGLDLSNLNSLRWPFALHSVNPEESDGTRPIPTLNEWGLITLSAFALLISVYYLRIRKAKASS
ncbi:MAG: hypothetical protein DHS20C13_07050 [Thermodesulfobacteriota bacterium]|nr:MAG: hypothetical protein DHS20C13_07050 [Thermodesulfobacteriota bacterium]